jgi:hypothetical protein
MFSQAAPSFWFNQVIHEVTQSLLSSMNGNEETPRKDKLGVSFESRLKKPKERGFVKRLLARQEILRSAVRTLCAPGIW